MRRFAGNGTAAGGRRVWPAVGWLCLIQFVDVMGVTVVVTALPAMLADLRAPAAAGGLIATGYAMFFGGLLMLAARLGDRFGARRVIIAGLAVFAAGSLLAATATTVTGLTAARCLQGAAAGLSVPSALRLVSTVTDDGAQRHRAIAAWSAAGAAAGASGFVVGGVATQVAGWRVVFWAYVLLAVGLAAGTLRLIPADRRTDARTGPHTRLPWASAVTFTTAVMAFVVATTMLTEPGRAGLGAALLVASLGLALAYRAVDRRSAAPLAPRDLLAQRPLRHGAAASLLNTATTSSTITLAALYLQRSRGDGPLSAALQLLPFSLAVIVGATLAAPVLSRTRPQLVVATGLAIIAVGNLALVPAAPHPAALAACVAISGAGIGLSSVAATGLGTGVHPADRGTASGIINTAAQLGTALGTAALLLLADLTTGHTPHAAPAPAWTVAGAVGLIAAAGYARPNRRRPRRCWTLPRLATGFPRSDVEDDFRRQRHAHQRARFIDSLLRRHPDELLTLDQVIAPLGRRGEHARGLQIIPVASVVGSLDRRPDFDRRFRPTTNRVRERWTRLALAQLRGTSIPPIDVYRIGDTYFVKDGHHRLSLAHARQQPDIEAYVTDIQTRQPPPWLRGGR